MKWSELQVLKACARAASQVEDHDSEFTGCDEDLLGRECYRKYAASYLRSRDLFPPPVTITLAADFVNSGYVPCPDAEISRQTRLHEASPA